MAVALETFTDWLGNKLKDLNTDESVFGSYITGILDSDETPDEKSDALQGILSEIVENESNISAICTEIFEQYAKFKEKAPPPRDAPLVDVDVKLAKLLESQCLQTTRQRQYTAEEKKIREAILSQYSQMTDDEAEEDECGGGGGGGGGAVRQENGLHKNTNAQTVAHAEKEKRENARIESQKKKEKDKEDREKQKQLREEKKEKRKTQKGERRR